MMDWNIQSVFVSRSLSKHESNYCITELELLGIVFELKRLRPYLYGEEVIVHTDHSAL